MGAVTPETCRVTLQWINICILLHLVGYLLILNYDARNRELKKLTPSCADCLEIWSLNLLEPSGPVQSSTGNALPFFSFRTQDCGIWPVEHSSCLTLQGRCGWHAVTLLHLLPWITSNLLSDADEILSLLFSVTPVELRTTQCAFRILVWEFHLTCCYKCGWFDRLEQGKLRELWVRLARISKRQFFNEWLPSRIAVVIFKAKKRAVCTDGNNPCITSSGTGSVDAPLHPFLNWR